MLTKLKALRQHQGFMRYFQNTSWLMGEKILRMFVGLFVGIWVARYLGPEQFGLLSYAQSFVFLFTAIATLGLDGIVVRELVKDETQRDVLLGTAFGLKLIGAILILPVLAVAVQLTSNDNDTNLLVFIIASATIFQSFNVIDFYYQSKVLSKYVALANTVSLALSSIIKIALLLNDAPLVAFAVMTVFDVAILSMGLVYYYKKNSHLKLLNWYFEWPVAKRLLKDSWPLILSGLVISVYMKIDQVMIKEMLDVEAVGQYAAAVRLSEAWYFIPMAIASSLFPAILNAKKISEESYYKRLQMFLDLLFWIGVCISLPIAFLSKFIILFLYGESYIEAIPILAIHAISGIFVAVAIAQGKHWLTLNLQNKLMYVTFMCALMNVLLNNLLIPIYGIAGAAFATLISYAFGALVFPVFFYDVRKMLIQSYSTINLFRVLKCLMKK